MDRLPEDGVAIDVGTGSGAIALAIKDERPDARVLATEVYPDAMEWAKRNREEMEIDVELIACDLMSGVPSDLEGEVDVIVANPPYVAESDRLSLPADVVDHEPHEALFAGGNGTSVIERLSRDALAWLKPDGWLVLEIGETMGEAVGDLLTDEGYTSVHVHLDLSGRDRIVEGRKP